MRKVILLGAAAVLLAGCDQLPFFKVSSPQRKPGLWEETLQSDRTPTPVVTQWCFDAASDHRSPVLPKGPRRPGACQKFQISKSGGGYTVDSTCSFPGGGITLVNHATISGDYSAKYVIQSTVNVTGASDAARDGEHKSTVTWVWKSADCPSDMSPGQVKLPTGEVVDMAALRGMRPGGGGGGRSGGRGG
ncbi:MAG TPA: DUF3617 family protein [Caulobacteraceae bacterium]|jgi:hypothetical protein